MSWWERQWYKMLGGNVAVGGNLSAANLLSGTYTPTLDNTTNISASTAYACQYMRVGSVVTVSGKVDITATATGLIALGMTIPVASNFASNGQCGGAGVQASDSTGQAGCFTADSTNDRATFYANVASTSGRTWFFSFTYQII